MAVTTILFKRGNTPFPAGFTLNPGEPAWSLNEGKLYIGLPDGGIKLINSLSPHELAGLQSELEAMATQIQNEIAPQTLEARRHAAYRSVNRKVSSTTYAGNFVFDEEKKAFCGSVIVNRDGTNIASYRELVAGQAVMMFLSVSYGSNPEWLPVYIGSINYNSGAAYVHLITRREAVMNGVILLLKDYWRGSITPMSVPRYADFELWHMGVAGDLWNETTQYHPVTYKLVQYTPKVLTGGNIYIQNSEPSNPQNNDVWFDTRQIGE